MLHTSKPTEYYAQPREDFLVWANPRGESALDVGCGAGALAPWLRARGFTYLAGIEVSSSAAEIARARYDLIVELPVEHALPTMGTQFDLIVCADVLEHLADPWTVLDQLRSVSHRTTVLVASIPNIRHWRAVAKIAFGAGFEYEESGIFDSTHLRFFARPNVEASLRGAGWSPVRWGSPRPGRLSRIRKLLGRLSGGWTDQWLARQIFVVAVRTMPRPT
jgi:SAM-dependent methyltransferase